MATDEMRISEFASMTFDEMASFMHVPVPQRHRSSQTTPQSQSDELDYEAMLALDQSVRKRGVSLRKLSQLPLVAAKRSDVGKKCSICLLKFSPASHGLVRLPCKHLFHATCIEDWFRENRTCPVCRLEVES